MHTHYTGTHTWAPSLFLFFHLGSGQTELLLLWTSGSNLPALPLLHFSLIFSWQTLTYSLEFTTVVTFSWKLSFQPQAGLGGLLVPTATASASLCGSTFLTGL